MNRRRRVGARDLTATLGGPLWILFACSGEITPESSVLPASPTAETIPNGTGIEGAGRLPPPAAPGIQAREPLAARLTKTQYKHTLEDLFQLPISEDEIALIPSEFISEAGFESTYDGQRSTPTHITAYASVAWAVAAGVDPLALSQRWAGCADLSETCQVSLVQQFSGRLFRRPASEHESVSLENLLTELSTEYGGAFEPTVRAFLSALLQFPQFLYRMEAETLGDAGQARSLTGHELASRLSYFLWQSTPDDELLRFAAQVDHGAAPLAGFEAQVERLIADADKLSRARHSFWADYTLASSAGYAAATPEVAVALRESIVATMNQATGADQPLTTLFETQAMMLTPALADLLGIPSKGPGLQSYDSTSAQGRVGVLTHPGFLAGIGSTSFVARGVVISDRVLCQNIAPAPATAGGQIADAVEKTEQLSPRQASDFRFGLGGACEVCHKTFEPVAFGLERFDVLGRYVEEDEGGRPLFENGYLQNSTGENIGDYADSTGLMALLAQDERVPRCFAKNVYVFGTGREFAQQDNTAVDAVLGQGQAAGGTFLALLRAVALSPELGALTVVTDQ